MAVESTRFVAADLVHGHRSERVTVRGYAPRAELYRVIDADGRHHLLEGRGLVLTDRLADKLAAEPLPVRRAAVRSAAPADPLVVIAPSVAAAVESLNAAKLAGQGVAPRDGAVADPTPAAVKRL